MGMMLSANNCQSMSINWNGWRYLKALLSELGADTSAMSSMNDGEEISKETCRQWSHLIEEALIQGRIREIKTLDTTYIGNYKITPTLQLSGEVLSNDSAIWLDEIAKFFYECHGCQQY